MALVAGAVGLLIIVGAIVGFILFGHAKSAANSPAQSTTQAASLQVAPTYAPFIGPNNAKRPGRKPATTLKSADGSSPSPLPSPTATSTPAATPAPQSTTTVTQTDIAKAKHQAALHLAAVRRLQAAQANANNGSSTALLAGSTTSLQNTQPAATAAPTPEPATATPDAQPTPVYAPRVVVDARFVDRVAPVYPDIAREQGAQGTAIVLATVGPKGNVISVALDQSTGNKMLDQSALLAARTSRFQAPEIGGNPATETYRIVYTFSLNS